MKTLKKVAEYAVGLILVVGFYIILLKAANPDFLKEDYDCPNDYKGKLIVGERYDHFILEISCGEYEKVYFPPLYMSKYDIGDIIE